MISQLERHAPGPWQASLGSLLLDLVDAMLLPPGIWQSGAGSRQALHQSALQTIDAEVSNPALSVGLIASRLRISERHLHSVFRSAGETPARAILDHRLLVAAEKLGFEHERSIGNIAIATGFSDPAHFSRAFSRKFGRSPRAYRLWIASKVE